MYEGPRLVRKWRFDYASDPEAAGVFIRSCVAMLATTILALAMLSPTVSEAASVQTQAAGGLPVAVPAIQSASVLTAPPAPTPDLAPAPTPLPTPAPAMPTVADAKAYLAARFGTDKVPQWGMSQSQCASDIFQGESQWDPHATNKSSGAYGIPQASPKSKMGDWAIAAADAARAAGDLDTAWKYDSWQDNPVVQAEWGADYMVRRYGSPCQALVFRSGYYDADGVFTPGHGWY